MRTTTTFRVRHLSGETDWKGDSVRVTNCDYEGCEKEPTIVFDKEDMIPIEYTCRYQMQNIISFGDMSETQLSIDYEAMIPMHANTTDNERQLQWRILLAAVEQSGLDRCDFDKQRMVADEANRRRSLESLDISTTLYSIRSDLESSSTFEIPCRYLEQGQETQCIPVRTVLTLKYQGEEADAWKVQDYVKYVIQKFMLQHPEDLYVKDVAALQYVGNFEVSSANQEPTTRDSIQRPSTDNSVIQIGTIISATSAVLLLISLFIFRRRPYKEEEEASTTEVVEIGKSEQGAMIPDLEAVDSSELPNVDTCSSFESNRSSSPSSPRDEGGTEDKGQGPMTDSFLVDTGLLAVSSSDSEERQTGSLETPHALPPRPPRRESVQLKMTRRKRRRKKKRPTLKRINSRENVNAMEAIPEQGDDTGSEFESEGSEYSTDEEASSNQSSSTCSTPLRTQSLPGSRTSSPSHRRYGDADDNGSSVRLIIEALDFPFGTNKEESSNSNRATTMRFFPSASPSLSTSSSVTVPSDNTTDPDVVPPH